MRTHSSLRQSHMLITQSGIDGIIIQKIYFDCYVVENSNTNSVSAIKLYIDKYIL